MATIIEETTKTAEDLAKELELSNYRISKLLEYIKYLITTLSAMSVVINNITENISWYLGFVNEQKVPDKQKEILDFLKEEFKIEYEMYKGKKGSENS